MSQTPEQRAAAQQVTAVPLVAHCGRAAAVQLSAGFGLALLLVGTIVAVELAAGWLRWRDAEAGVAVAVLGLGLGRALAVAVLEETLFRGLLLAYLQRPLRPLGALVVSSGAFALVHAWNANVSPLAIAGLAAAGALFGLAYLVGRGPGPSFAAEEAAARGLSALAYVVARGLPLPIGLHAGWNFFEGSVFGLPVSGSHRDSLLIAVVDGPEAATGGAFGPEGGLVGFGAMLVTAIVLWSVRGRLPACPSLTSAR